MRHQYLKMITIAKAFRLLRIVAYNPSYKMTPVSSLIITIVDSLIFDGV